MNVDQTMASCSDPSLPASSDITAQADKHPTNKKSKGAQSKEVSTGSGSRASDGRKEPQIMEEPVSFPYEEHVDEKKIDDLEMMDGREILFSEMELLKIQPLTTYYFSNDTIKFKIPDHVSHFEAGKWVKEQMSYLFHDCENRLGGRMDLNLDKNSLKFSGSFHDSFTICCFDAQVWKVEFGRYTERDYALEFRQTSKSGDDAFGNLVWKVAACLMEMNAAKKFGNGRDILPSWVLASDYDKLTCHESFTKEDLWQVSTDEETSEEDLELANVTKDPDKVEADRAELRKKLLECNYNKGPTGRPINAPVHPATPEPIEPILPYDKNPYASPVPEPGKMNCMLKLEKKLLQLWTEQIEQRIYPATGETIRILRKCCYENASTDETVNAVRSEQILLQALCEELKLQLEPGNDDKFKGPIFANAEVCINILEIFKLIVKDPSNDKLLIDKDIMQSLVKCTNVFSGFFLVPNEQVPKVTVIMQVALQILDIFTTRHGRDFDSEKWNLALTDLREFDIGHDTHGLSTLLRKVMNKLMYKE